MTAPDARARFRVGDRVHIHNGGAIAPDPRRVYTVRAVEFNVSQPKGGGYWYRMHELPPGYSFRDDDVRPAEEPREARQLKLL